jgi:phosphohistidine phosphatase
MELYLVQHAKSRTKEEDPERPLTDEGREEIEKMAIFAGKKSGIEVRKIIHSGKLRAKQTAEILAGKLRPPEGCEEADGLDPMAEPSIWAEKLERMGGSIMLVGHLPHLGNLAGVILCGEAANNPISLHNSGIIKLVRNSESRWLIDWIVVPSVIGP